MNAPVKPASMPTGGAVMAIVPQTFEELQRISNTIIAGRLAPANLAKVPKAGEDPTVVQAQNIAAVSSVLMAGAELGLPPMVALRSFTVINGRPALFADGNVAVIRKARDLDGTRICKTMSRGFNAIMDADGGLSDQSFGWCESERADTGETYREEFSIEDAKIAGLWDPDDITEREVWEYDKGEGKRVPKLKMVPNDSPWHRYWKKMLMWRATGYCLRWLYADILGGMVDEYEARDIPQMIDVTPAYQSAPRSSAPPEPPTEDVAEESAPDAPPAGEGAPTIEATANVPEPPAGEDEGQRAPLDAEAFLAQLEEELTFSTSELAVEETFDLADAQVALAGDDKAIGRAFALKEAALHRVAMAAGKSANLPTSAPFMEADRSKALERGIAEVKAVLDKGDAPAAPPEPPADDDGQDEIPFT